MTTWNDLLLLVLGFLVGFKYEELTERLDRLEAKVDRLQVSALRVALASAVLALLILGVWRLTVLGGRVGQ